MKNLIYYVLLLGVNVVFADSINNNVKQSFLNMLKGITDVNQQRMETLKKLMELQDQVVNKAHLNYFEEPNISSEEDTRHSAIMTILDYLHQNDVGASHNVRRSENINLEPAHALNLITEESKPEPKEITVENVPLVTAVKEEIKADKAIDIAGDPAEALRKNWMKTVRKKGTKTCIKACKAAHKSFCKIFSCSRKAKKTLKKECKSHCKLKFNGQIEE